MSLVRVEEDINKVIMAGTPAKKTHLKNQTVLRQRKEILQQLKVLVMICQLKSLILIQFDNEFMDNISIGISSYGGAKTQHYNINN